MPDFVEIIFVCSLATLVPAIALFLLWFNRDPDRHYLNLISSQPFAHEHLILSPSDGRILYIRKFAPGSLPTSTKFGKTVTLTELEDSHIISSGTRVIGIYLSPFDVHVTRAPISGDVTLVRYRKGHLFSKELFRSWATMDEMSTCVIKGEIVSAGVVQMAAYVVRRVILNTQEGDKVEIGNRIGRIKMGSQVDLVLGEHASLKLLVEPGDKVKAGKTLIAKIEET